MRANSESLRLLGRELGTAQKPNPWSWNIRPAVKQHTISSECKPARSAFALAAHMHVTLGGNIGNAVHNNNLFRLFVILCIYVSQHELKKEHIRWFYTLMGFQMMGPQMWKSERTLLIDNELWVNELRS